MTWKLIEGNWRWPYRVSDQGDVQRQIQNGTWKSLKPYPYNGQWRVELLTLGGGRQRVQVSKLVVDAFKGGTPPGMLRVHRNGMTHDNAVENIIFMSREKAATRYRPGNSRPVLKVDRFGQVVEVYSSQMDAARANHICQTAISKRCLGLIADPYRLDGYNYIFEK